MRSTYGGETDFKIAGATVEYQYNANKITELQVYYCEMGIRVVKAISSTITVSPKNPANGNYYNHDNYAWVGLLCLD